MTGTVTAPATAKIASAGKAPDRFGMVINAAAGSASRVSAERLAASLRRAGKECIEFRTTTQARGTVQAAAALDQGCDAVIACGGDGTVHEALQAIVERGSQAAMGILPLGTGNVIAHDLGIPRDPDRLAAMLLRPARRRVAVGRVEIGSDGETRYFLAMVGVGCDAHALYHLPAAIKDRFGVLGYYWQSWRSLLTSDFAPFGVEISGAEGSRAASVTQVLAVRIADFGGLWRRLAPGAGLERDDLRVVLFHGRSRIPFIRYMAAVLLGREPCVPGVDLVSAVSVVCAAPVVPGCVYVQADGEYLGRLPVRITVVPQAVELLVPPNQGF